MKSTRHHKNKNMKTVHRRQRYKYITTDKYTIYW